MNNAWLFAREGGYESEFLSFTRHVVQHQLKKYAVPPCNPGRQSMLAAQNAHIDKKKFDSKGHDISEYS